MFLLATSSTLTFDALFLTYDKEGAEDSVLADSQAQFWDLSVHRKPPLERENLRLHFVLLHLLLQTFGQKQTFMHGPIQASLCIERSHDQLTPSGPRSRTTSGWPCSRCQSARSHHVLNTEDTETKDGQAPCSSGSEWARPAQGFLLFKGNFPSHRVQNLMLLQQLGYHVAAALSPSSPCQARTWNPPLPPHLTWNDCDWLHCLASACTSVPMTTWPPASVSAEYGAAAKEKTNKQKNNKQSIKAQLQSSIYICYHGNLTTISAEHQSSTSSLYNFILKLNFISLCSTEFPAYLHTMTTTCSTPPALPSPASSVHPEAAGRPSPGAGTGGPVSASSVAAETQHPAAPPASPSAWRWT